MTTRTDSRIIDGRAMAARILGEVAAGAARQVAATGVAPGLAVVRAGEDPASAVCVKSKRRAASRAGVRDRAHLPAICDEAALVALVAELNADAAILVQLPPPASPSAERVLGAVSSGKDADGFPAASAGRLVRGLAGPVPWHRAPPSSAAPPPPCCWPPRARSRSRAHERVTWRHSAAPPTFSPPPWDVRGWCAARGSSPARW